MGFFHIKLPHINIGKAVSQVEHAVGKGVGNLAHEVGHVASSVGKDVGHLGHSIGVGASAVGKDVGHLAQKIGHAVDVGAHSVGKEVGHLAHEVGQAAGAVGKEVGHLAHEVEHDVGAGVGFVGHEIGVGLHLAGHVLVKAAEAAGDFVLRLRHLRPTEIQVARSVFLDTVPYERVLLIPLSGASSRPFTVPGTFLMTATGAVAQLIPGIGSLFLASELLAGLYNKYVIFIGSEGYQDALHHPFDEVPGQVLIHELTHVWQGHNSGFSWDYVYHSIKDQCFMGGSAYNYNVTGHPAWDSLRVESQARVVDQWFEHKSPTYGTLFSYVRDNIRGRVRRTAGPPSIR